MKKSLMLLVTVLVLINSKDIVSSAMELGTVTEMNIYLLEETTDVKEQDSIDSETVITLNKGTPVLLIEENQKWVKIQYQDFLGYVQLEALIEFNVQEDVKDEFSDMERTFDNIYKETRNLQRKNVQDLLWKIVLIILLTVIVMYLVVLRVMKMIHKNTRED